VPSRRGLVRPEGLEPPAYRFEACRSIQLSYGRLMDCRLQTRDISTTYGRIRRRQVRWTAPTRVIPPVPQQPPWSRLRLKCRSVRGTV
jgi:hypothetical protein